MSDSDHSGKASEEAQDAGPSSSEAPSAAVRQNHSHGSVFFLYAFLLIAGAGAYYWFAEKHAPAFEDIARHIDSIDAERAQINMRVEQAEQMSRSLAEARQTLTADVAALQKAQRALEDSVTALYAKDKNVSLTWVLAEAEYLVLAATQRLALERDVRTAIAALKAADIRLRLAKHPDLIEVREQIAKDIAGLEAANLPDVEGLAIYLAEAVARADELPTKPIADIDMSLSRMRNEDATVENWKGMAKAMWADLVSLIKIKDGELPGGVLFDPELRYFLEQNLRLELASARLSVLRRDNANFQAASKLIIDFLTEYYDTNDAAVAAILTRLKAEQATDLNPVVPGISASLDAVRAKRISLRGNAAAGVAAK